MKEPTFPSQRQSPPTPESGPEKIHTKEEVLSLMLPHIKGIESIEALGAKVNRELSDEHGLYLLEVHAEGAGPGELNEYQYIREGSHANKIAAEASRIDVIFYDDGVPCGSNQLAKFDAASGVWK